MNSFVTVAIVVALRRTPAILFCFLSLMLSPYTTYYFPLASWSVSQLVLESCILFYTPGHHPSLTKAQMHPSSHTSNTEAELCLPITLDKTPVSTLPSSVGAPNTTSHLQSN